jgi:cryptochrome
MSTAIVWLRSTLRVHDNPLLDWAHGAEEIDSVIPVFVLDTGLGMGEGGHIGPNRMRFLYDSLTDLDDRLLREYSARLLVLEGRPEEAIPLLAEELGSAGWLLCDYQADPRSREQIGEIEASVSETGVRTKVFPSVSTILDVEEAIARPGFRDPKSSSDIGAIMGRNLGEDPDGYLVPPPSDPPASVKFEAGEYDSLRGSESLSGLVVTRGEVSQRIDDLGTGEPYFPGGESEALDRLRRKVSDRPDFVNGFSKPATMSTNETGDPLEPSTTGLSPYLSTGCLSVRKVWQECAKANIGSDHTKPPQSLIGQLMFREMFYLLSRSVENWDDDVGNSNCKPIEWGEYDEELVRAWEEGMTGFPYIDAMMRQLEATGWMHHLGRHAVSCFLTRGQLWQNWKHGRDVFDRKLVDSDWAVNNGNWLWLAGVAPFSMPYYRVYNPCPDSKSSLNVETKEASFIRHWVPELASFPSRYIFEPHLAPERVQKESGCIIGTDYPSPIVDRKESRRINLDLFKESLSKIA